MLSSGGTFGLFNVSRDDLCLYEFDDDSLPFLRLILCENVQAIVHCISGLKPGTLYLWRQKGHSRAKVTLQSNKV